MSNFTFNSNAVTSAANTVTSAVQNATTQDNQSAQSAALAQFQNVQNMTNQVGQSVSRQVQDTPYQGVGATYVPGSEHQFYVAHGNVLGFGGSQLVHEAEVYDPMRPFASQINNFDALQRYDLSQHFSEGQKYIGNLDSGGGHTVGSLLQHASDRLSQYEEYNQAMGQVNQGINQGLGYASNVIGKSNELYSAGAGLASSVSSNFQRDPLNRSGAVPSGGDAAVAGIELLGQGLGGAALYSAKAAKLAADAQNVAMKAGELGEEAGLTGAETVAAEAAGSALLPELAMGIIAVGAAYEVGKEALTIADYFTGGKATPFVEEEAYQIEAGVKDIFSTWF